MRVKMMKSLSLPCRWVLTRWLRPWAPIPAWLILSFAMPVALAQAPAPSARRAAAPPAPPVLEQPNAARPGGPQESIKVHGHWVIEVRNPDGSLAQRREFDNELQSSAIQPLVKTLMGNAVPAGWEVKLLAEQAGSDNAPCSHADECLLQQRQLAFPCSTGCSDNLVASYNAKTGITGFILSGWVQADKAGDVGNVETWLFYCTPDEIGGFPASGASPVNCQQGTPLFYSKTGAKFTAANLPATSTPLHPCGTQKGESSCEITGIEANQVINVSVNISFQ